MSHARNALVIALVVALTGLAGVAAVVPASRHGAVDDATLPEQARRFLDLTGDSPTTATTATGAKSVDDDGRDDEVTGPRTPQGYRLTPGGTEIDVLRFPIGMTASADGATILVSSDSGGPQGLTAIDAASLTAVPTSAANLFMGVAATPDGRVYASGGNANRIFRYQLVGPVVVPEDPSNSSVFPLHSEAESGFGTGSHGPAGDGIAMPGYPGSLVLGGQYLYVAGTLSEQSGKGADACPSGQSACGRVSIIDTTTDAIVRRVPVGLDVYGVAADPVRHRVYASNWADEAGRGGAKGGTVSVIDVTNPATAREIAAVGVGHHPSAVQLSRDRTRLFVANTNDDSISVLDVSGATPRVVATQTVRPFAGAPAGSHPDAFAVSPDGNLLFVALSGMNAVEVLNGRTGLRTTGQPRYIPTGYYPSALTVTGEGEHYKLWIANAKGKGPGPGINGSVFFNGTNTDGSVNVVDLPANISQEEKWTESVIDNDLLDRQSVDACSKKNGVTVSEVLCPPGGAKSPIKHVIYIVTENKTFDQYFGDLDPAVYDADPSWTLYGAQNTPNHHAMAARWSLGDRFYSDAEVSVTGHSWTSGAVATDYQEKTWPADYDAGVRGDHGSGDPHAGDAAEKTGRDADAELDDPEGGYLFEAFRRAGAVTPDKAGPGKLSMAIYGESTARESGNMDAFQAPKWKDGDLRYFDTCRANQFIHGKVDGTPGSGEELTPSLPEVGAATRGDCEARSLPPQFHLKHWTDVFKATGKDVMPNFIYMSLPVNHTAAANLGSPTPQSMVADNDYAIGLITEAMSNSPFWGSTVIMQTEDDTQISGDHVSPLRDYLQVSGPLAKPGANHQWGSMPSLLRTIETIFRVKPISLHDRLALPQHNAFLTKIPAAPDLKPYVAVKSLIPFALNPAGIPGQAESMAMDWSTYDLIDEATVNAILYSMIRGWPLKLPPQPRH